MFKAIVVGTDGSETAEKAVDSAVDLAARVGATLHIVSAYEPVVRHRLRDEPTAAVADQEWAVTARTEVDATLAGAAARARVASVPVEIYARQGDAADAVLDVAEERAADLIVLGNKGMTGARRFLLGSVPNRVSHHAPCSVLIIRTH
jgi:nucleotide-binding universal stress UspA family protein